MTAAVLGMGGLPEAEKTRDVTDAGRAGGANGVAVGSYASGIGDGRVGDEEEFARTVKRSKEGVGGVVVPIADVEVDIGILWW
jgi:hypothetical protein